MKQALPIARLGVVSSVLAAAGMVVLLIAGRTPSLAAFSSLTPGPTLTAVPGWERPARSTATPGSGLPGPTPTPSATSPFVFPTVLPDLSPTPGLDCSTVFPPDSLEAIAFGRTTLTQLEAAFGPAVYQTGRPIRFRFEAGECRLLVTVGVREAQEAEIDQYGTLGFLLDRYGTPAAVGLSLGNLVLLEVGSTILLYPQQGLIAVFHRSPGDLTRAVPVDTLYLRPAYDAQKQLERLNAEPLDWLPPLR